MTILVGVLIGLGIARYKAKRKAKALDFRGFPRD